jgi:mRNA interferase RelE/StbE
MTPKKPSKTANGDIPSKKSPESSVWTIEFLDEALEQFEDLAKPVQQRIFKFLHGRLSQYSNPRLLGEALSGPFAGYWKYRVGDYRIVCEMEDRKLVVLVVKIGHRREVYR